MFIKIYCLCTISMGERDEKLRKEKKINQSRNSVKRKLYVIFFINY